MAMATATGSRSTRASRSCDLLLMIWSRPTAVAQRRRHRLQQLAMTTLRRRRRRTPMTR